MDGVRGGEAFVGMCFFPEYVVVYMTMMILEWPR